MYRINNSPMFRSLLFLILLILFSIFFFSNAHAVFQKISELQYYSFASWLELDNDKLYIGTEESGSPMLVIDVSIPHTPSILYEFIEIQNVKNIAIKDSVVFVTCSGGLKLIDYNESGGYEVSIFDNSDLCHYINIEGDYAILSHQNGFKILDVTDSSTPVILGEVSTSYDILQTIIVDNYLYALLENGIEIYDITNVSDPQLIEEYTENFGFVDSFAINEEKLYLADWDGFYKYDISDPYNIILDNYDSHFYCENISFKNGLLHTVQSLEGYCIYDMAEFDNPIKVNIWESPRQTVHYAQDEQYLYILDWSYGLQVIKKDVNENPYEVNHYYEEFSYTQDFDFDEDYIYIADINNGLVIYDKNNPDLPISITDCNMGMSLIHEEDAVIISYGSGDNSVAGIRCYDVTDPQSPQILSDVSIEHYNMQMMGDYVFAVNSSWYLFVYDFSDPTDPQVINQFSMEGGFDGYKVKDNYLYMWYDVYSGWAFKIFDISDLQNPNQLSQIIVDKKITNVEIFDDIVYAGYYNMGWYGSESGFKIIDISDPEDPIEVNDLSIFDPDSPRISGFGSVYCNLFENELVVSDNRNNRLMTYNVDDLTNPIFIEDFYWNIHTNEICFDGTNLLVSSHFNGVTELNWSDFLDSEQQYVPELNNTLLTNYPNPFNPSTTISFSLNTQITESTENTEIEIFNIKGQKVKSFPPSSCHPDAVSFLNIGDMQKLDEGRGGNIQSYSITWNGTDKNNNPVSSGIYIATLKSGNMVLASHKMMLLK